MSDPKPTDPPLDREHVTLTAAAPAGDPVPTRVLLVPWGHVASTSGDFVVDAEAAGLVIEAFQAHGTDLPIDYEHQTLGGRFTSPSGQAPAAGWVKQIEAVEGEGVFAAVTWTPPALEQLAARQYRYLSPVALVRKSDRKLVALHSVALTNKPAIANLTPIVNRGAEGAGLTSAEAVDVLRACLTLPPDCPELDVLVAAGRQLRQAAEDAALLAAQRRVAEAQRQNRLTVGQHEWALTLARKDPELFDAWLATAPVVVPLGRTEPAMALPAAPARRKAAAEAARAEFHACPALAGLTSEEAYVAAAVRGRG
jgi:phage I-like protein